MLHYSGSNNCVLHPCPLLHEITRKLTPYQQHTWSKSNRASISIFILRIHTYYKNRLIKLDPSMDFCIFIKVTFRNLLCVLGNTGRKGLARRGEGVDSLAVLLSSVWKRHPLGIVERGLGWHWEVGVDSCVWSNRESDDRDSASARYAAARYTARLPSYFIKLPAAW